MDPENKKEDTIDATYKELLELMPRIVANMRKKGRGYVRAGQIWLMIENIAMRKGVRRLCWRKLKNNFTRRIRKP